MTAQASNRIRTPQSVDWPKLARRIAREFGKRANDHDQTGSFVSDNFRDLKDAKFFSAAIPLELGGGGAVSTHTVAIADAGVRNLLGHFGLIDDKPVTRRSLGLPPTRMMHMPGPDCFLICDDRGIFEILVDLEAAVTAGEPIGRIHFPERPDREPVIYRAGIAGTLIGRTHKTLMEPGDFLALIAQDM